MDKFLLSFQTMSSIALAVIACCALNDWRKSKIYSERRNIALALNSISGVVDSCKPLVEEACCILELYFSDQDRCEKFQRGIENARLQAFKEYSRLKIEQTSTFVQADCMLSSYKAEIIYEKLDGFLISMSDLLKSDTRKLSLFGIERSDYNYNPRQLRNMCEQVDEKYSELKAYINPPNSSN